MLKLPQQEQKKVITGASADVQFSAQNQVKSKKKVITFADVQFSAPKGHQVRRPQFELLPNTQTYRRDGHYLQRDGLR